MQRLTPYFESEDARGRFLGITQRTWGEVNFIETAAGQVRGGHYHASTVELFFIIAGEVDVVVESLRTGEKHAFRVTKGDLFLVEPMEVHTLSSRTATQWLNMLSPALDPQRPDFHRPDEGR